MTVTSTGPRSACEAVHGSPGRWRTPPLAPPAGRGAGGEGSGRDLLVVERTEVRALARVLHRDRAGIALRIEVELRVLVEVARLGDRRGAELDERAGDAPATLVEHVLSAMSDGREAR